MARLRDPQRHHGSPWRNVKPRPSRPEPVVPEGDDIISKATRLAMARGMRFTLKRDGAVTFARPRNVAAEVVSIPLDRFVEAATSDLAATLDGDAEPTVSAETRRAVKAVVAAVIAPIEGSNASTVSDDLLPAPEPSGVGAEDDQLVSGDGARLRDGQDRSPSDAGA